MSFSVETAYLLLAVSSAVTAITLLGCWRHDRADRTTLMWFGFTAASVVGQLAVVTVRSGYPTAGYLADLSNAGVSSFLVAAALLTFRRRVPVGALIAGTVALFALLVLNRSFGAVYNWRTMLGTATVLAVFVPAGIAFLRAPVAEYGISARVLGVLLISQAAVRSVAPHSFADPALAPWMGIALVSVYLALMTAIIVMPLYGRYRAAEHMAIALKAENASRRQAQQRFEDMVETGYDFVWERDAQRRMTYVSPRAEEITGIAMASFVGKTPEETRTALGHKSDPSWDDLRNAMEERRPFRDLRYVVTHPKTRKRQVLLFSGKPIYGETGDFLGYRGTGRDITESVEARSLVAAVLESVGSRIGSDYLQGMVEYLGRTLQMDRVFVGEIDRDRQRVIPRAVFGEKKPGVDFEFGLSGTPSVDVAAGRFLVIPKNVTALYPGANSLRLIGASGYIGAPLVDSAGSVLGLLVLIRYSALESTEIAETMVRAVAPRAAAELGRHVAEARSRHHERLLQAVLDNMPAGITIRDRDGRFIMVNRSLGALYGIDERKLIGRDLEYFIELTGVRRENVDRGRADSEKVLQLGEVTTQEISKLQPDGPSQDLLLTRFAIPDAQGQPTLVGTVILDVTAQKRMERSLRQSQKMDAVGQLAGGIAHDFNNILGAIMGYAKFIADDALPGSENGQYASRILAASTRAKDLIRQLLAFSRRSDSPRRVCRVSDVVRESIGLLRPLLPATTSLDVADRAPNAMILADSTQMTQVLLNICVNGSDALAGRPGTLRLEIQQRLLGDWATGRDGADIVELGNDGYRMTVGRPDRDGAMIVIRIADTGQGMDRAILERLFEPFFTTKSQGKGSGLGLPMVQGIVLEHGGALTVTTRKGEGTTVEVYLPAAVGVKPDAEAPAKGEPTPLRSQRKRRIMVIDDDIDFGDMVAIALERTGYEVAICHDPKEALEAFGEDPGLWDVVVTDQTMPGMSGTQVIGAIKTVRPDIGCVLLTGYGGQATEEAAKRAGADAFATKPIDPASLAQIIARLLRTPTAVA